jgi:hypothetical protein
MKMYKNVNLTLCIFKMCPWDWKFGTFIVYVLIFHINWMSGSVRMIVEKHYGNEYRKMIYIGSHADPKCFLVSDTTHYGMNPRLQISELIQKAKTQYTNVEIL